MNADFFSAVSPLDHRYRDSDAEQYFSDAAYLSYKLKVELALIKALAKRGVCPKSVVTEVEGALKLVALEEVEMEEAKVKHDIRALVNVIRSKVSDEAKPYVHMTATSYDIIDTANAARFRDATKEAVVPTLKALEKVLIDLAIREAETAQVGRTHGQHAVPTTFGYALAHYVSRLGGSILALEALADELTGKFSGAVGAYNSSSLFFDDPEEFEKDVLSELHLKPVETSTQVTQPEPMVRLLAEVTIAAGILANLADDMRHLQRTEIGEVGEEFAAAQVGSSTMPQKRNPISFENVKSLWKIIVSRVALPFMDQISEHQRDLTNSASGRTYGEILAYLIVMAKRLERAMAKLSVDRKRLSENMDRGKGLIAAEPLYLILASLGHPDAHEKVRTLTLSAEASHTSLGDAVMADEEIKAYFARMTDVQKKIIENPSLYTGVAAKKAERVASAWKKKLSL